MSIRSKIYKGLRTLGEYVKEDKEVIRSPEEGQYLSGYREDYSTDSYIRQLTPYKLGAAMRDADQGSTAAQYEVFEVIEQDPHITAVTTKRRDSLLHLPFEIRPSIADDGSQESKKAKEAADLCNDIVFGCGLYDGIQNWYEGLFDLSDAICKGFAVSQIVWKQDAGRWVIHRLERWPQKECQLGDPFEVYQQDQDQVRIITDMHPTQGEIPQDNQWIIFKRKSYSQPLARAGLFRSITWNYILKNFSLKDWSIFVERYGMPLRIGKYHAGAQPAELTAIKNAVSQIGKDAYCVIPEQAQIEFLSAKGASGSTTMPYPEMVQFCNDEISKAILGNTMTAEQGDAGARSLGEVYERAELKLTKSDAILMEHALKTDLLKPLTYLNLGEDYPVPDVNFIIEGKKDMKERSEVLSSLHAMGVEIKLSQIQEEFSIEETEDGEELIDGNIKGEEPEEVEEKPEEPEKEDDSEELTDKEQKELIELTIKEAKSMLLGE